MIKRFTIHTAIRLTFTIVSVLITTAATGQPEFFLRPVVGIGFPISTVTESNSDIIKKNVSNGDANFGIYLQTVFKDQSSLSIGFLRRSLGYGFSVILDREFRRISTMYPLNSFIVNYNYPLFRVRFAELKRKKSKLEELGVIEEQYYYLAIFDVEAIIGLNFNHIQDPELESFERSLGPLEYRQESTLINQNNFSIPMGLRLQFLTFNKRRLQFDVIYNLGLSELVKIDISLNTVNKTDVQSFSIVSKGSELEIHFGYPIGLKKQG